MVRATRRQQPGSPSHSVLSGCILAPTSPRRKIQLWLNSHVQPQARQRRRPQPRAAVAAGHFLLALVGLAVVLTFLWFGFQYLKGTTETSIVSALFAIVWGVGGVAALFTVLNMLIESLPARWRGHILPFLFFLPATIILFLFLTIPALITFYQSFH